MDGMARSNRATFRLPAAALFVPVLLFVCITPLATAGGAWWVLYIVPVIAFVWVLTTHTTATADRMTTYGLLGTRTMTWEELDQLELPDARWAIAVAQDGRRLRLPMVRPRDMPRLVAVSGGSLRLGDQAANPPGDHLDPSADGDQPPATPDHSVSEDSDVRTPDGSAESLPAVNSDNQASVPSTSGPLADVRPADVQTDVQPADTQPAEFPVGADGVANGGPLSRANPRG